MIKKWDIMLIAGLLILSCIPEVIFLLYSGSTEIGGTYAAVQVDGKPYKDIPLSAHHGTDWFTIQTENGYNTVVVRDQSIGIVEADCPDHICVSEGFISQPGATVICLPHNVLIEVRSYDSNEPDIIPAR